MNKTLTALALLGILIVHSPSYANVSSYNSLKSDKKENFKGLLEGEMSDEEKAKKIEKGFEANFESDEYIAGMKAIMEKYHTGERVSSVAVEENSRNGLKVLGLVAIASLFPLYLKYGIRRR